MGPTNDDVLNLIDMVGLKGSSLNQDNSCTQSQVQSQNLQQDDILLLEDLVFEFKSNNIQTNDSSESIDEELLAYKKLRAKINMHEFKNIISNVNSSSATQSNKNKISILSYENSLISDAILIVTILSIKPLINASINLTSIDVSNLANSNIYKYAVWNISNKIDYIKLYSIFNFLSVNIDDLESKYNGVYKKLIENIEEKLRISNIEYEAYTKHNLTSEIIEYFEINIINVHNIIMHYIILWFNINFLSRIKGVFSQTALIKLYNDMFFDLDNFINNDFLKKILEKVSESLS